MTKVFYAAIFSAMVLIYSAGILAALWAIWLIVVAALRAWIKVRDIWATIKWGERRIKRYYKHLSELDAYLDEKYREEVTDNG